MHVQSFFECEAALAQPDVEGAAADRDKSVLFQTQNHLVQRDVLRRLDHADDESLMIVETGTSRSTLLGSAHLIQAIAVEIPIPNRAAADRPDTPPADVARTRWRRSSLNARAIFPPTNQRQQEGMRESQNALESSRRFRFHRTRPRSNLEEVGVADQRRSQAVLLGCSQRLR